MAVLKRKCDNCGKEYNADSRNLKRGWGLCCSKSCAAKKREKENGHQFRKMIHDKRSDWERDIDHPFSEQD